MYPEEMCAPMREDLTSVGFVALRTPEAVSELLDKKEGTVLVMVNSVCGCAAGNARPAVKMTTQFNPKVDVFATVFAGQDIEATAKAAGRVAIKDADPLSDNAYKVQLTENIIYRAAMTVIA